MKDKYDIEADAELIRRVRAKARRGPTSMVNIEWGGAFRIAVAITVVQIVVGITAWLVFLLLLENALD